MAKLDHLGIIRVTGADAASFLQGQLTNDVALLGMNESRLAAFCSAKGRMQASFTIYKRPALDTAPNDARYLHGLQPRHFGTYFEALEHVCDAGQGQVDGCDG